jgi:hypothetical protein
VWGVNILCRFIHAFVLAALAMVMPAASEGTDTRLWKSIGWWSIGIDPTQNDRCFVVATYQDGTLLRFGFQGDDGTGPMYLGVGNEKWTSLTDGDQLQFQLDRRGKWPAPATATGILGFPFLLVGVEKADFFDELARRRNLRVHYKGKEIANLRLDKSRAAVNEWIECQKSMGTVRGQRKPDPFAADKTDDPFSE